MPHTASLPKMPDIPFSDSGAGPSNSDSQMDGLTGQPPFAPADVMSSDTRPAAMKVFSNVATSTMSVPVSAHDCTLLHSGFSHITHDTVMTEAEPEAAQA